MQGILIATLVVGVVGLVLGLALVTASKKFYVETDERVTQVRECLRGANCGACGYAGCDAVAEAIVKGEARVDACPGNSTENIAKIAAILGKEAIDQDPQVAYVRCAGTCEATKAKANYVGLQDCRAAVLSGGLGFMSCDYGCIGLGSCVKVCPEGGITIENGIAHINASKCIGCGMCAKTCPKHVIEMHDRVTKVAVSCSNHDRGPAVKKVCVAGCIGCGICVKQCDQGAVTQENNLATVDPEMVGEVLSVMKSLAQEGMTMLVVTHEMAFARDVSNHVVYMANGVICEQGSPAELFGNPQKQETRDFLARFTKE